MRKLHGSELTPREIIIASFYEKGVTVAAVLTTISAVITAIVEDLKAVAVSAGNNTCYR